MSSFSCTCVRCPSTTTWRYYSTHTHTSSSLLAIIQLIQATMSSCEHTITQPHNQLLHFTMQEEIALHNIPLHQKLCEQEDRAVRLAEENQQLRKKLNTFWGYLTAPSIGKHVYRSTGQQHSPQSTTEGATKIVTFWYKGS